MAPSFFLGQIWYNVPTKRIWAAGKMKAQGRGRCAFANAGGKAGPEDDRCRVPSRKAAVQWQRKRLAQQTPPEKAGPLASPPRTVPKLIQRRCTMSKERAPWPQCYYDELDARKRKDLLDKAIENGEGAPEENAVRQKLWALRYGQPKKNMPPADGYAGLWITMNLWRRDTASRFRVRAAVKELSGMLKQLGIDAPQASSLEQELVYRELVHAVRLYLSTCTEGSYNTRFLGMVRLKPEQLVDKIVNEICGVAYELPERLGMEEQFAPLRRAAYEAFSAAYPEEVGKLDSAIFGKAGV